MNELKISVDDSGRLTIETPRELFVLGPDETTVLREFLAKEKPGICTVFLKRMA